MDGYSEMGKRSFYTNLAASITGATIDVIEWDTLTDTATIRVLGGTIGSNADGRSSLRCFLWYSHHRIYARILC